MALNTGATPVQQTASMEAPKVEQQQYSTWNFGQAGSTFGASMGRSIGSEVYNRLKTELVEIYKNVRDESKTTILDLDNQNEPQLAYSSLIIATRSPKLPNKVAYHILVLEASGERAQPVVQYHGQKQIEVYRVTSDAVDEVLVSKAKAAVLRAFPNCEAHYTESTVIPSSFNVGDKNAVYNLAWNTSTANGTELGILLPAFRDLNLTQIPSGSQYVVNMTFANTPIADDVGTLMRSDFQLSLVAQQKNHNQQKQNSLNNGGQQTRIADVAGFIEMLWAPLDPMVNPYQPVTQRVTQKFAPRAVITSLKSAEAYTPGCMLLAVAQMDALVLHNNYYQTFRPTTTKDLDLKDIGALNIEGNFDNNPSGVSSILETKSQTFTSENMGMYLNTLVRQGMMVSIDCPESGPQSWYTGLYAAAAVKNGNAYDMIYAAAQELTNGNFGKHFPKNAEMFIDLNNRVHLGTYVDRNGATRDIRDIDYLAAANILGAKNVQALRQFTETYLNQSIGLAERLSDRKKMISSMTNESAVFTGYALRVTFSIPFIDALRKGIQACAMDVRINSPMSGADFNAQRAVANFASNGLSVPSGSFMGFGVQQNHMQNYMNLGGLRY
jgi:hypothetical protein